MLGGESENPELWAFLESFHLGDTLSGVVAAIKPFGVFVALDDGPAHPVYPGVGFITAPELSWRRHEAMSDVVQVGQRVSAVFLQFDTYNLEARLSLRATEPDPFQAFAEGVEPGSKLTGTVTKLTPIGAFARVADGIEGLLPVRGFDNARAEALDGMQVGDELTVVVTDMDRQRRRFQLGLLR